MNCHLTKLLFCTATALLFTACASTPGGLRADQEALRTFTLDSGYQTILKRLIEHNAECAVQPLIPLGQVIFDVQNYTDLKTATITKGASGIGTQIYMVIELTEPTPGKTTIKVWSKIATDRNTKRVKMIADGATSCDI